MGSPVRGGQPVSTATGYHAAGDSRALYAFGRLCADIHQRSSRYRKNQYREPEFVTTSQREIVRETMPSSRERDTSPDDPYACHHGNHFRYRSPAGD
jgi:hypothetical protein